MDDLETRSVMSKRSHKEDKRRSSMMDLDEHKKKKKDREDDWETKSHQSSRSRSSSKSGKSSSDKRKASQLSLGEESEGTKKKKKGEDWEKQSSKSSKSDKRRSSQMSLDGDEKKKKKEKAEDFDETKSTKSSRQSEKKKKGSGSRADDFDETKSTKSSRQSEKKKKREGRHDALDPDESRGEVLLDFGVDEANHAVERTTMIRSGDFYFFGGAAGEEQEIIMGANLDDEIDLLEKSRGASDDEGSSSSDSESDYSDSSDESDSEVLPHTSPRGADVCGRTSVAQNSVAERFKEPAKEAVASSPRGPATAAVTHQQHIVAYSNFGSFPSRFLPGIPGPLKMKLLPELTTSLTQHLLKVEAGRANDESIQYLDLNNQFPLVEHQHRTSVVSSSTSSTAGGAASSYPRAGAISTATVARPDDVVRVEFQRAPTAEGIHLASTETAASSPDQSASLQKQEDDDDSDVPLPSFIPKDVDGMARRSSTAARYHEKKDAATADDDADDGRKTLVRMASDISEQSFLSETDSSIDFEDALEDALLQSDSLGPAGGAAVLLAQQAGGGGPTPGGKQLARSGSGTQHLAAGPQQIQYILPPALPKSDLWKYIDDEAASLRKEKLPDELDPTDIAPLEVPVPADQQCTLCGTLKLGARSSLKVMALLKQASLRESYLRELLAASLRLGYVHKRELDIWREKGSQLEQTKGEALQTFEKELREVFSKEKEELTKQTKAVEKERDVERLRRFFHKTLARKEMQRMELILTKESAARAIRIRELEGEMERFEKLATVRDRCTVEHTGDVDISSREAKPGKISAEGKTALLTRGDAGSKLGEEEDEEDDEDDSKKKKEDKGGQGGGRGKEEKGREARTSSEEKGTEDRQTGRGGGGGAKSRGGGRGCGRGSLQKERGFVRKREEGKVEASPAGGAGAGRGGGV